MKSTSNHPDDFHVQSIRPRRRASSSRTVKLTIAAAVASVPAIAFTTAQPPRALATAPGSGGLSLTPPEVVAPRGPRPPLDHFVIVARADVDERFAVAARPDLDPFIIQNPYHDDAASTALNRAGIRPKLDRTPRFDPGKLRQVPPSPAP